MIGRTLSHYKVLEEISRGGMGIVYKALDLKLNRDVALKHPNIAVVYEIDEVDGADFIAMELIEGEKLSDILRGASLSGSVALPKRVQSRGASYGTA